MRDFFLLPEQDKMSIYISRSPFHRGYHPLGEENALGSPVQDLKEVFDMALELPMDDPDVRAGKPFHGPNAWPEVMPRFKPTMLRLYEEWRQVCARISSLFAVEFGLPDDYFVNRTNKPMCQLRAAKYPPQETPSEVDPIGCGAHTDYGIVSIIWQIDAPGLQLKNRDGDWVNAPLVPGAFVCPIGDATEILTNGDWKATVHRVINLGGGIRHSSAFFFDPNYDCELAPLPAFVGDTRPPRFERTTMGAHVTRGFNGTFRYRTAAGKDGHS
jgi:isopenicillin N synthase-like dioxygenase